MIIRMRVHDLLNICSPQTHFTIYADDCRHKLVDKEVAIHNFGDRSIMYIETLHDLSGKDPVLSLELEDME